MLGKENILIIPYFLQQLICSNVPGYGKNLKLYSIGIDVRGFSLELISF